VVELVADPHEDAGSFVSLGQGAAGCCNASIRRGEVRLQAVSTATMAAAIDDGLPPNALALASAGGLAGMML